MVIGIADGDTLTVLNNEKMEVKIRLAEIDAPEKRQAFGTRSKQSLSDLCFGKQAEIIPQVKDRYQRTVARVKCSAVDANTEQVKDRYQRTVARVKCSAVDANTEQVKRGMAWVYPRYAKDQNLYVMQNEAKEAKRGLWVDSFPTAPWEFRLSRRAG